MHPSPAFSLIQRDPTTQARRGRLHTLHGVVETPVFMPVGTQGTVKASFPWDVRACGAQIILSNTYHLHLRPGSELVRQMGGLHRFMSWDGPILTDSGGFQVFSLSSLRRITDEGIHFRSHLDGAKIFLGPREAMEVQANLGSDIAMVLDECPPNPSPEGEARKAVERTLKWAGQCLDFARQGGFLDAGHQVFGIVQGAQHAHLREDCAAGLGEMGFSGYAIGGVSVGEAEPEMLAQVGHAAPLLPPDRPRYVMGVGTPPQLLAMVALGVDMFDCVLPTRAARHGTAYTPTGKVNLKNERWKADPAPLVEGLDNPCCRHFSRSYLRHLVVANEPLGGMLLTLHNLHFYADLMAQARTHIEAGDFGAWHRQWIERYQAGNDPAAED